MQPELDVVNSPIRWENSNPGESWTTKALRETQLLKAAAYGFGEIARDAMSEHTGETLGKASVAFALSAGLGKFAAGTGVAGGVARIAGVGMGIPFAMDILKNAGKLGGAVVDTWKTGDNMEANMAIAGEELGRFAFDTLIMTAAAVPGYKFGSKFSSPSIPRELQSFVRSNGGSNGLSTRTMLPEPAHLEPALLEPALLEPALLEPALLAPAALLEPAAAKTTTFDFSALMAELKPPSGSSRRMEGAFRQEPVRHELAHEGFLEVPKIEVIPAPPRTALELLEQPVSMSPPAYKVLTKDGASPWAKEVLWSKPEQQPDGTWLPGAWMEPKHNDSMALTVKVVHLNREAPKDGLYVSHDPLTWTKYHDSGTNVVYEVQIGDARSSAAWGTTFNSDFIAQRVRLLRPLSELELKQIGPNIPKSHHEQFQNADESRLKAGWALRSAI